MQVNLNKPIKNLNGSEVSINSDGSEVLNTIIGKVLADHLVSSAKGDPLKFYGWGIKLTANEPIEIDESDKQVLKSFIQESDRMPILIKAQILQELVKSE